MKKTRRMICLILCAVLSLALLAGCGTKPAEESKQPDPSTPSSPSQSQTTPPPIASSPPPPPEEEEYYEELLVSIGDRVTVIDIFNPAFQSSQICLVTNMIYDCLVYRNMQGEYSPELAKEWKTDDYKIFTFYLRDDVYFHNGEKFTADDVKFTIDTGLASPGSPAQAMLTDVESCEVINDYEVKITLSKVNVDFLYRISYPSLGMVNREAYAADSVKGPWIGTGPFSVSDFLSNDYVEFTRNDDYFGTVVPTKQITFKYIAEETARLIMFENDELDFCGISAAYLPTYENDPRFEIISYTMDNCNFVGFNMKNPLMADINFRMAVAYAFNNEECLAVTLSGRGVAVDSGTFWGYRTEYKNTDIPKIPVDLEKAKEYLAKTSYNGESIELVAAMAHPIMNAQVLQSQLAKIGINTTIYETDGGTFATYTAWGNTKSQIIVNSGAWSNLASSCKSYLYPGQIGNKANYENPEVIELLDRADAISDPVEREKIFREVQEIIAEDIPYLGVFHMSLFIASQEGGGGLMAFPNNNHDYSQVYRIKK